MKESLDAQQQKFKENMLAICPLHNEGCIFTLLVLLFREKVNVRNSELNQLLQSAEKERLGSQNEAQKLSDRLWAMKSTNEEVSISL